MVCGSGAVRSGAASVQAYGLSVLQSGSMSDAEKLELQEYRRQDLLQRLQAISREHWSSHWQLGLEHDVYLMTFCGTAPEYGMGVVSAQALSQLKRLAELTQTWWLRSEDSGELLSIALDDAERRFSSLIAQDATGAEQRSSVAEVKKASESAAPSDWDHETTRPPWDNKDWHVYRLRSNPVITLFERKAEGDWELRFGSTTISYVMPAWVKQR
jgi:hypothetical protein